MIPSKVIERIDLHLSRADEKHPVFCYALIPNRLKGNHFKKAVKEARSLCELTGSAYDVVQEEVCEVFEAIEKTKFDDARKEIYDTIATLLRLDKSLENFGSCGFPVREL